MDYNSDITAGLIKKLGCISNQILNSKWKIKVFRQDIQPYVIACFE